MDFTTDNQSFAQLCIMKRQHIYIENGTNGKGQLPFFAANGKWKQLSFVCLLQTETENRSLFFLVGKR
jgi:hypothetical protein